MENVFIKKTCFRVRKIKKCPEGWVLGSARGNKETDEDRVVFISNKYYAGKMPPFFRWPWQKLYLEFAQVYGFICSAKINDKVLFEISRADFPPDIKAKLEEDEKKLQKTKAFYEQMDNDIKAALAEYLPKIPVNPLFEDEMADLHVCFRAYLKLHWQKSKQIPDFKQRLSLATSLCKAAQRICKRHFDFSTSLSIVFMLLKAPLFFHPSYRTDIKFLEEQNPDAAKSLFATYYEIDEMLDALLPKVENESLKRYLIYVVEKLCLIFISDYVEFARNNNHNQLDSDTQIYRNCCSDVKLPYFSNFILPDTFAKNETETFFQTHSL